MNAKKNVNTTNKHKHRNVKYRRIKIESTIIETEQANKQTNKKSNPRTYTNTVALTAH